MTVIPAIAGNLLDAFLKIWLSIIPPPVGLGWQQRMADVELSKGALTSPIKVWPSAVVTVNGVRRPARIVLGRIGSDIVAV
jgi:hypothetical protein